MSRSEYIRREIYKEFGKLLGRDLTGKEWKPIQDLVKNLTNAKLTTIDELMEVIKKQRVQIKNQSAVLWQLEQRLKHKK